MNETNDAPTLYQILEADRDVSPTELKRAYRKLALKYHPDKNPGNEDRFRDIQHAYNVLSDEKKRSVYDQYGEMGLEMMEKMPWIDAEVYRRVGSLSMLLALAVVIIIAQFAFLCVRVDGKVDWNWNLVFIPAYLVLAVVGALSLFATLTATADEDDEDRDEEVGDDHSRDGHSMKPRKAPLLSKLLALVFTAALITAVVLIPQAIEGYVPVWSIAIPYAILELYPLVTKTVRLVIGWPDAETPKLAKLQLVADTYLDQLWRILQIGLILARAQGSLDASWPVVFIPTYLGSLSGIFTLVGMYRAMKSPTPLENKPTLGSLIGATIAHLFGYVLLYGMVALIVIKLEYGTVSLAVAIVPVWIVLILLACLFGCCIPCATSIGGIDMEDGTRRASGPIAVNRRIEFRPPSSLAGSSTAIGGGGGSPASSAASSSSPAAAAAASSSSKPKARGKSDMTEALLPMS
ncbi:hypothetical protein GGF31_008021 [Allomyces arbusculus]|nr:hypothetical protein GGF31_008021 [Allomyces arbusculus]